MCWFAISSMCNLIREGQRNWMGCVKILDKSNVMFLWSSTVGYGKGAGKVYNFITGNSGNLCAQFYASICISCNICPTFGFAPAF